MDTSLLPEHYAHISSMPDRHYRAFCRCGFTGRVYRDGFSDAQQEREEHLEAAIAADQGEAAGGQRAREVHSESA